MEKIRCNPTTAHRVRARIRSLKSSTLYISTIFLSKPGRNLYSPRKNDAYIFLCTFGSRCDVWWVACPALPSAGSGRAACIFSYASRMPPPATCTPYARCQQLMRPSPVPRYVRETRQVVRSRVVACFTLAGPALLRMVLSVDWL